jgi:hypothetical protein
MIVRRAATAPFDEDRWKTRPLNVDLGQGREETHDLYCIELPVPSGEDRTATKEMAAGALLRTRSSRRGGCGPRSAPLMGASPRGPR